MNTAPQFFRETTCPTNTGFNSRLRGLSWSETAADAQGQTKTKRFAGWDLANGMVAKGKLFAALFPYEKQEYPTWQIAKCFKDGNAWCCVGEGFENLQESDNYAFGDTQDEAIKAYGDLMQSMEKTNAN